MTEAPTGEKGGAKLPGRMGDSALNLSRAFNGTSNCFENQAGNAWKRVSASQLSWRLSICNGRHRFLRLLSALGILSFLLGFDPCSARRSFTTWPLWREDRPSLCAERAKRANSGDTVKWWPYTALVQTFFLHAALGKRAKKQEAMCSGGRIRFAKVPTFAFPTGSYSMQNKFPFAEMPGLQCWPWFKLTGCT